MSALPDVEEDGLYAEERHEAIARLVTQRGRVAVSDLADNFEVTTETVRRDLDTLERAGLLRRVHGGAVPVAALSSIERSLTERDSARAEQKERIAKAAVAQLPGSGGTVILDGGTTTARFAARLPLDRKLSVLTNSLPAAVVLTGVEGLRLDLLGGRLRGTTQACVGDQTTSALAVLHVDVVFLGTNGISVTGGLTTPDSEEAAVKRAMVAAADRRVLLADSSKFGRDYLVRFAQLDNIDVLVTDDELSPGERGSIEAAGVEVVLA